MLFQQGGGSAAGPAAAGYEAVPAWEEAVPAAVPVAAGRVYCS